MVLRINSSTMLSWPTYMLRCSSPLPVMYAYRCTNYWLVYCAQHVATIFHTACYIVFLCVFCHNGTCTTLLLGIHWVSCLLLCEQLMVAHGANPAASFGGRNCEGLSQLKNIGLQPRLDSGPVQKQGRLGRPMQLCVQYGLTIKNARAVWIQGGSRAEELGYNKSPGSCSNAISLQDFRQAGLLLPAHTPFPPWYVLGFLAAGAILELMNGTTRAEEDVAHG